MTIVCICWLKLKKKNIEDRKQSRMPPACRIRRCQHVHCAVYALSTVILLTSFPIPTQFTWPALLHFTAFY